MSLRQITALEKRYNQLRKELDFFDAGAWLGEPPGFFPLARRMPPRRLLSVLRDWKIRGALVSHWAGWNEGADVANARLAASIPGMKDCFAVATGLPTFPDGNEFLDSGRKSAFAERLRAVRIFPAAHGFSLERWCIGALCEELTVRNIPLFIWHTEARWEDLARLAGDFAKLNIVVESQYQKVLYHTRRLFPLMKARPNVYCEISNIGGFNLLDFGVREIGAERFIFGTYLPASDPSVPMGMIMDARISTREKKLIAGDNLRRLISGVQL
jgi:hypothetical protein